MGAIDLEASATVAGLGVRVGYMRWKKMVKGPTLRGGVRRAAIDDTAERPM